MKISQKTIQSIQAAVQIEEVIADFIPLKKKGQNYWACCPFHHEKTASFSISPAKGFYKCFGCDAAGDAIAFVQQIEGSTFVEALAHLAHKYGIPIETESGLETYHDDQAQRAKESLYIVLNMAKAYYANLLWTHPEAAKRVWPYLEQRSIAKETAQRFELGYSLDKWDGLYAFAHAQGVRTELLVAAGLVVQKEEKTYDRFRGRLLFPIHNSAGQVVAFGARRLSDADANSPKYVNSPETAIYHKGELLYGLSFAKNAIKQQQSCYLVEGYTDVLAFHKAGLEHVVASAGTSLTETQVQTLHRFSNAVTLVFDGDQAGIQAALRGIDKLLAQGLQVKIVVLPPAEDPDSYLRKVGPDAFVHYLQHTAQDFIAFKAGFLWNQSVEQNPAAHAKAIRSIVESIVAIPDELEQRLSLKKCSTLFSLEEDILEATYQSLRQQNQSLQLQIGKKRHQATVSVANPQSPYKASKHIPFKHRITLSIEAYEREIMRILLLYGSTRLSENQQLYEYILLELGDVTFRSDDCKQLFAYFQEMLQKGTVVDLASCLESGGAAIQKMAIHLTASPHEISAAWHKKYGIYVATEIQYLHQMSLETILRLKIRLVQELIEQNRTALQQAPSEEEEYNLLRVHQLLKQTESSMAKQLGIVVAQ